MKTPAHKQFKLNELIQSNQYEKVIQNLETQAEKDTWDWEALGYCYRMREASHESFTLAKNAYANAALNGSISANASLAELLEREQNFAMAAEKYLIAARAGNMQAKYRYFVVQKRLERIDDEGLAYLTEAAIAGHPFARRDKFVREISGKNGFSKQLLAVFLSPWEVAKILIALSRNFDSY
jgi:hypothetical protein